MRNLSMCFSIQIKVLMIIVRYQVCRRHLIMVSSNLVPSLSAFFLLNSCYKDLNQLGLYTIYLNSLRFVRKAHLLVLFHVGKIILKIPWKNLTKESIIVTIEDVYVLAGPVSGQ